MEFRKGIIDYNDLQNHRFYGRAKKGKVMFTFWSDWNEKLTKEALEYYCHFEITEFIENKKYYVIKRLE